MKRRILGYAASCALAIALLSTAYPAQAQNPANQPYSAYNSAPAVAAHPPGPQYLMLAPRGCGQAQPLPAQTYAYGWFGVAPRQHTNALIDYYGFHWIWH